MIKANYCYYIAITIDSCTNSASGITVDGACFAAGDDENDDGFVGQTWC